MASTEKVTDNFKKAILNHLEILCIDSPLFAKTFANPNKNIDDCVTYILNQVQKSGCQGFADNDIYNMALHYYDEQDIEIGGQINGNIVVNHVVELTEEEIKEAKKEAQERLIKLQIESNTKRIKKNVTTSSSQQSTEVQQSLF